MEMKASLIRRVAMATQVLIGKGFTLTGSTSTILSRSKPVGYTTTRGADHVGKTSVIASCVGEWIDHYTQAPFIVRDPDGNPVYDSPVLDLLQHPGRMLGESWLDEREFKALKLFYQLTTGTAYGLIEQGKRGDAIGISLYPHGIMVPESSREKRLWRYRLTVNGKTDYFEPEQVIRFPWSVRDPDNPIVGVSPLQSCFNDAESYSEVSLFVREFLQNGAFPGTLVVAKNGFPDEETRKANKTEFQETFGSGNRGAVGFFTGDLDIKAFAHGLKDLDLTALRDTPEAAICAAFRVPAELIGVKVGLENSAYSNKREARYHFATGRVASMWEADAQALTATLLPLMGYEGYSVAFDTTGLAFMQEDADKRYTRAKEAFVSNLITRDEARAEMGYDAVDNANVFSVNLQKPEQAVGKMIGTKSELRAYKDDDADTALFKKLDGEHQSHIDTLSKSLSKAVERLSEQVIKEATKGVGFKRDYTALSERNLRKLFLDGTEEARVEIIQEMIKRAVDMADFDFDEISSWLDDAAKEAGVESGEKIKTATETMKKEILDIIEESPRATAGELTEKLSKYFDVLGSSHVVTIAVTTATATRTTAQNESWKAINKRREDRKVIKKKWLSMRDKAVRDSHSNVDGQVKEMDELFDVGSDTMEGPGKGSVAEENINCRCVEVPVTVKKGK